MKIELVRIGNSRGIRIAKALIEQCGFGDTVELHAERERLVIAPAHPPRHGWKRAFAGVRASDRDDRLAGEIPPNAFDSEEWTW